MSGKVRGKNLYKIQRKCSRSAPGTYELKKHYPTQSSLRWTAVEWRKCMLCWWQKIAFHTRWSICHLGLFQSEGISISSHQLSECVCTFQGRFATAYVHLKIWKAVTGVSHFQNGMIHCAILPKHLPLKQCWAVQGFSYKSHIEANHFLGLHNV